MGSSSATSNFALAKRTNFEFQYNSGTAPGSPITFNVAGYIEATTGVLQWSRAIKTSSTTAATSVLTGSLIASGGLGVNGEAYIKGNIWSTDNGGAAEKTLDFTHGTGTTASIGAYQQGVGNRDLSLGYNNLALGAAMSAGGGSGVVFIGNAGAVPSSNPVGGGILYVQAGALKYRGSSGTVTTIGLA